MAKNYQSEVTQFINKYKADHPGTDERQRAGRARLWDKQLDTEALDGFRVARVAQDPYVYYQND